MLPVGGLSIHVLIPDVLVGPVSTFSVFSVTIISPDVVVVVRVIVSASVFIAIVDVDESYKRVSMLLN